MPGPDQTLKHKTGLTCICLVNFKHELNLVHLFLSVANSWYSTVHAGPGTQTDFHHFMLILYVPFKLPYA
jgi:hypothetical protein